MLISGSVGRLEPTNIRAAELTQRAYLFFLFFSRPTGRILRSTERVWHGCESDAVGATHEEGVAPIGEVSSLVTPDPQGGDDGSDYR